MQILKRVTILLAVCASLSFGLVTFFADDLVSAPCKIPLIECLDVWDPVICDGGVIYSNICYARRACATGCVAY